MSTRAKLWPQANLSAKALVRIKLRDSLSHNQNCDEDCRGCSSSLSSHSTKLYACSFPDFAAATSQKDEKIRAKVGKSRLHLSAIAMEEAIASTRQSTLARSPLQARRPCSAGRCCPGRCADCGIDGEGGGRRGEKDNKRRVLEVGRRRLRWDGRVQRSGLLDFLGQTDMSVCPTRPEKVSMKYSRNKKGGEISAPCMTPSAFLLPVCAFSSPSKRMGRERKQLASSHTLLVVPVSSQRERGQRAAPSEVSGPGV